MRVVFMGTPDIAATCLNRILEAGYDVVGVYTQPDRPKNRGMKLAFSPVKEVALAHDLPVYQPTTFKDDSVYEELKALDPDSYAAIDIANGQRVVRALEVCLMTGKPFSSFKTSSRKSRDFEIEKIGLTRPRDVLYDRINRRVINMIDDGLVDEVRSVVQYRDLAALQTVGYKEIFDWFDYQDGLVSLDGWGPASPGDGPVTSLDRAIELIQRNTRHYAKRQLTWFRRDTQIHWIDINNDYETILHIIDGLRSDCSMQA